MRKLGSTGTKQWIKILSTKCLITVLLSKKCPINFKWMIQIMLFSHAQKINKINTLLYNQLEKKRKKALQTRNHPIENHKTGVSLWQTSNCTRTKHTWRSPYHVMRASLHLHTGRFLKKTARVTRPIPSTENLGIALGLETLHCNVSSWQPK